MPGVCGGGVLALDEGGRAYVLALDEGGPSHCAPLTLHLHLPPSWGMYMYGDQFLLQPSEFERFGNH